MDPHYKKLLTLQDNLISKVCQEKFGLNARLIFRGNRILAGQI
jgi:hypothetical protein